MSWFKYFSRNFNSGSEPSYIYPPMRRGIDIDAPFSNIKKDDLLFVKTDSDDFYTKFGLNTEKTIDNKQYIVVYETGSSSPEFIAVRSNVVNDILFFQSAEDHSEGVDIHNKYYLYYGNSYLKYVSATPYQSTPSYKQISNENIIAFNSSTPLYSTSLYNLNLVDINNYFVTVLANSEQENGDSFSYYNKDIDWLNYKSSKPGAKVSGSFDGPSLKITALKKPNGGKIKLKIVKKSTVTIDDNIFTIQEDGGTTTTAEITVVNEHIIDLYSLSPEESVIYENNSLEYAGYYFLIEVIEQDNASSRGSEIEFVNYKYLKNNMIKFRTKEFKDGLAFKS